MSFEWHRIHKWEDRYEQDIVDDVVSYITEYYGVDEISDLSQEQIDEIEDFKENHLNEYSVMQWGFSWVMSTWDSEQFEEENL